MCKCVNTATYVLSSFPRYKDSDTCEDHSKMWFEECAAAGNPTCEVMHANKIGTRGKDPTEFDKSEVRRDKVVMCVCVVDVVVVVVKWSDCGEAGAIGI